MNERMRNRLAVIIDQELGLVAWEDEEWAEEIIESVVHDLVGFLASDGWVRHEQVQDWRAIDALGVGSVVKDDSGLVYFRCNNARRVWRLGGMEKLFEAKDMTYPVTVLEGIDG